MLTNESHKKLLNVGVRIKGGVQRAGSHSSIGSFSKDVFERHTSAGSKAFSFFIYLDADKFVLLSFFSFIDDLPESFKQTTTQ